MECHREPTNATNRYAVAVTKAATIIGHLPRKFLKVCSLFLRRGGSIRSTVKEVSDIRAIYYKEGWSSDFMKTLNLIQCLSTVLSLNIRLKKFHCTCVIIFV